MATTRFAILLDGGFVTKALQSRNKVFPKACDVVAECARIRANPVLQGHDLLRIYFYDAPPASGSLHNPIDGSLKRLDRSQVFQQHESLLDQLELEPDMAVRKGEAIARGWKLGRLAMKQMLKTPRVPTESRRKRFGLGLQAQPHGVQSSEPVLRSERG